LQGKLCGGSGRLAIVPTTHSTGNGDETFCVNICIAVVNVYETGHITREQMARGEQASYHVKQWISEVFYSPTKPRSEAFLFLTIYLLFGKWKNVFALEICNCVQG
jgi:hypothetical protein